VALTKVGKEGVTGISNSSDATAITIDSSENVGIGTSSPDSLVHLSGANPKLHIRNSSDSNRGGYLQDNGTTFVLGSNSGVRNLVFSPDNTERMRITTGGQVFIGATSNASTESLLVKSRSNGNRAITASGLYASGGSVNIQEWQRSDGTVRAAVQYDDPTGGFIFYSPTGHGVTYSTSSDYRLKENVTYDWDATTRLKQLKPARFNFIADADTTVDGFLAHETQAVVPEAIIGTKDAVDADNNPEYQSIDQSKIVPLLVKSLQEAITKIETLETKVQALEDA
jgi:hypothetical protein